MLKPDGIMKMERLPAEYCTGRYDSPVGGITMAGDGKSLIGLWFDGQKYSAGLPGRNSRMTELPVFRDVRRWLDLYFSGEAPDFIPPISMYGSEFGKEVWKILLTVPYGHTMTYGAVAKKIAADRGIGRMSAQAVGGAVGHNPVSLIIPCHRIIGTDGSLTGYAGGLDKKRWLLRHEGLNVENDEVIG